MFTIPIVYVNTAHRVNSVDIVYIQKYYLAPIITLVDVDAIHQLPNI